MITPNLHNTNKGNLTLSQRIAVQILTYNSMYPDLEWSGFLIYKQISENEFYGEHLILLDAETRVHTGFDFEVESEDCTELTNYKMIKELNEGYKFGLIHTHNTMSSFFSGEDDSEFFTKTESYGEYLSLIVNYKGEMVAKHGQTAIKKETTIQLASGKIIVQEASHISIITKLDVSFDLEVSEIEKTGYRFCEDAITLRTSKKATSSYPNYGGFYGASYKAPTYTSLSQKVSDYKLTVKQVDTFAKFVKDNFKLMPTIRPHIISALLRINTTSFHNVDGYQPTVKVIEKLFNDEIEFYARTNYKDMETNEAYSKYLENLENDEKLITQMINHFSKSIDDDNITLLYDGYYDAISKQINDLTDDSDI